MYELIYVFVFLLVVVVVLVTFSEIKARKEGIRRSEVRADNEKELWEYYRKKLDFENQFRKMYLLKEDDKLYDDYYFPLGLLSTTSIKPTFHEKEIAKKLVNLNIFLPQCIFLDNYFRKKNGETIQIDLVAVGKRGIFVFESKDFSGNIYGSEKYANWLQYVGDQKNYFYSPIKQNGNHIKFLKGIVGSGANCISIIVFSNKADVDVKLIPKNNYVVKTERIADVFEDIAKENKEVYSTDEIIDICRKINQARINPDDNLREEHIKEIKDKIGEKRLYS